MEEPFTKIVSHIFNNWTALKLAVEHFMGGTNSLQAAVDFRNYMVQYCLYETNVQTESIQETIEVILDEEFDTICEDDSPKQIAQIMYRLMELLKQGKNAECEEEFSKLPTINRDWLSEPVPAQSKMADSDSEKESAEEEMDTEKPPVQNSDGWTQVKSKRKR